MSPKKEEAGEGLKKSQLIAAAPVRFDVAPEIARAALADLADDVDVSLEDAQSRIDKLLNSRSMRG